MASSDKYRTQQTAQYVQ